MCRSRRLCCCEERRTRKVHCCPAVCHRKEVVRAVEMLSLPSCTRVQGLRTAIDTPISVNEARKTRLKTKTRSNPGSKRATSFVLAMSSRPGMITYGRSSKKLLARRESQSATVVEQERALPAATPTTPHAPDRKRPRDDDTPSITRPESPRKKAKSSTGAQYPRLESSGTHVF